MSVHFSELQHSSTGIHASVVHLIGRQIVAGDLAPGEYLPEQGELSRLLGVSRTVVREATKVLAAKGLVESKPKRGTVVTQRSSWRLLDPDVLAWRTEAGADADFLRGVFEVREIIEPAAARLAAERASDDEIASLWAALETMGSDETEYLQADLRFHGMLVSSSHNDYLIQLVGVFGPALQAGLRATSPYDRDWQDFLDFSLPLHRSVLEAIVAHDPERADKAMQRLVDDSRRQVLEHLSQPATARK